MVDFSLQQLLLLALIGFVAGIINGTVGGGSLLTYPFLVAIGVPPVYAAATNTTGLSTGNVAALLPHIKTDLVDFRHWRRHAAATATGAIIGGSLLIALPERVFEFLVPILLVIASVMMLLKPKVVTGIPTNPQRTLFALLGSGIYSGYFGPGQGVIAMAVLMRDGRLTMHQIIVIKNFVISASNVVVATLFIATGHVLWIAACTLLLSVAGGGWFGAIWSKKLNPTALRWAVAAVGIISAVWFWFLR
ncbi:MAG: hypothetical protein RL410_1470 [Actinomycetota bacterium]|jgi:uncharacterized membrane protein YfcA